MTKPKPMSCICEKILGVAADNCDSAVSYICRYLDSDFRSFAFKQNGKTIDRDRAVQAIVELVRNASCPLITGIECIGVKNQQLIVDFAREAKAVVDSGLSNNGNRASCSLAREGLVTASFGEAISRSDLILVVGNKLSDRDVCLLQPISSNGNSPPIWFVGTDSEPSADNELYANNLSVDAKDLEATLLIFEATLAGLKPGFGLSETKFYTKHPHSNLVDELQQIVDEIFSHNYVTVINNLPVVEPEFDSALDSVHRIVKKLNRRTKAIQLNLACQKNSMGAENVLTWSTGFPNAVDLTQERPRSFGTEYCTRQILQNRECDALVLFGDRQLDVYDKLLTIGKGEQHRPIPVVHFTWGESLSLASANFVGELIEVQNLCPFPDDFVRFDEAIFDVVLDSKQSFSSLFSFLLELRKESKNGH